ncbi:MAG: YbbC/YhhH family protein [Verrucomicrobiota bacterium]|nr:YbbC/YhhH family protein [Verrucomicrobiota bacterium]
MRTLFLIITASSLCAWPLPDAGAVEATREEIEKAVQEALQQKAPLPGDSLVVPNGEVAQAIHCAVAGAVYGSKEIEKQRPFFAVRSGDFWVVSGYLPPDTLGGVAVTVIRAKTGEVIWITHGQ